MAARSSCKSPEAHAVTALLGVRLNACSCALCCTCCAHSQSATQLPGVVESLLMQRRYHHDHGRLLCLTCCSISLPVLDGRTHAYLRLCWARCCHCCQRCCCCRHCCWYCCCCCRQCLGAPLARCQQSKPAHSSRHTTQHQRPARALQKSCSPQDRMAAVNSKAPCAAMKRCPARMPACMRACVPSIACSVCVTVICAVSVNSPATILSFPAAPSQLLAG